MAEQDRLFSLGRIDGIPDLEVEAHELTPIGQFRDWIEKPEHLNIWMRYPAGPDDERTMRYQIDSVLDRPDEASPRVIFNLALKDADLVRYRGGDAEDFIPGSVLSAYQRGLTALSRSNKFSMQEHGHYFQSLTTLVSNQYVAVQRIGINVALRNERRGNQGNRRG